jgi:hypothetical protein
VDTGGCPYNYPIISDPVLANLGLNRVISAGNGAPRSTLEVPLPLVLSPDPFRQNWGSPCALEIKSSGDLRFNMVGEESAMAINFIDGHLDANPDLNEDQILSKVISNVARFIQVSENVRNRLRIELKEMRRHINSPDWDHDFDENDLELKE